MNNLIKLQRDTDKEKQEYKIKITGNFLTK